MAEVKVPDWAKVTKREGRVPLVDVDAELAYNALGAEYGVEEWDQYWLEVCYQSIKLDLQSALGFALDIHIHDPEKKFAQVKFTPGKGAHAATKGLGARREYQKLRGRLPG